jgi:predicted phosphodiesterase
LDVQRTLIVGDVHGCLTELEELLHQAAWSATDTLVLAGDLVAKGPDSQGVVQLAREKGAFAVLGNHDSHLLRIRHGGEGKKHHEQVARTLTDADWRYLEALPLYLNFEPLSTLVVHGGLVPGVPLEKQEHDIVINMRSFDMEGKPSKRIEGGVPWASQWPGPQHVVFGHDAMRGLQQWPHATGLDTGCCYGRQLTALLLPEKRLITVSARKPWSGFEAE